MFRIIGLTSLIMMSLTFMSCSSTRQPTVLNNLQIKVAHLERTIESKDQEIQELKYQVESLSSKVEGIEEYQMDEPAKEYKEKVSAASSGTDEEPQGIIRVPVATEKIQQALKNAGFYSADIDGKIGNKTKQAIKDFQSDNGLKADGIIGEKTWAEMKAYLK